MTVTINNEVRDFIREEARTRFLRYVTIDTRSDPETGMHPSTEGQWILGRLLKEELLILGFSDAELDAYCYVYASLPASSGVESPPITFCAHMDTSPSQSGANVVPVVHENYDGGIISLPGGDCITLSPRESPELAQFIGETVITSDGRTLLGADDKAGIAEIMAALACLKRFGGIPHPELRIVFTPDEEIGEGTDHMDLGRLGRFGYTVDGGMVGEVEQECFDAWELKIVFHGRGIHPGYAKGKMVNAVALAARFVAALPEHETPEHTEHREGFYHLTDIKGDENRAVLRFIIRDFEAEGNRLRVDHVKQLVRTFEMRSPGLKTELIVKDQYNNMQEVLSRHPGVVEKAKKAIEMANITPIERPIRGGTDGARLSFMGVPTPNIFSGGMMVHSKTEWIPEIALEKGAEVILNLCGLWAER